MSEDAVGECLGKFITQVIIRSILTGAAIIIDKHIVQRRDLVIRRGRQVQNWLGLPEWACVFSEKDPGMLDADIRAAAMALFVTCLVATLGMVAAYSRGTFWDPWALALGVVIPGCLVILIWLVLILSKRRRNSRAFSMEHGHCETMPLKGETGQTGQHDQSGRNLELESSIRVIWNDCWVM